MSIPQFQFPARKRKTLVLALTTIAGFASGYVQPVLAETLTGGKPIGKAEIEEILVTADFRQAPEMRYAASLSVVGGGDISARAAQHLDEVLALAPNVNFAAGASRGRYLQVRGIGERSQFVDPINPSVGLMIDGVNLSGVGNASTLFDVEQVEVLRGPQGTRFGASALAGMVNIRAKAPTQDFEGEVSAGLANYNSWQTGVVASGPLAESLLARLAVQQYRSDGFIENTYLGRDDTSNRDELTARGKLNWQLGDALEFDATLFYIDVDNGYDGFSLDNNRKTLSDQPGSDAQETLALGLVSRWTGNASFTLETTLGVENTDVHYGYDEDWTHTAICAGLSCDESLWGMDENFSPVDCSFSDCTGLAPYYWWYSTRDDYYRDRQSTQLDIRLVSTDDGKLFDRLDWVAGVYAIDQQEYLVRAFFDWDLYAPGQFTSRYDTTRLAVYGELSLPLTERLTLTSGGRVEDFSADYRDSRAVQARPDETLWGGEISLKYQASANTMLYGLVSRGFKAGGVNGEALGKATQNNFDQSVVDFLASRLVFDTESARNLEVGLKGSYWQQRWQLRLAAFDMQRDDVQLNAWYNQGQLFVGYTDNGAAGSNRGLELETSLALVDSLSLFASLGFLDSEIKHFYILDDNDVLVDKSGRDQAHAPRYQFNLGADWTLAEGLTSRLELDGRDEFYYSDSHDQKSNPYTLVHASVTYTQADVTVKLWGRNLGDKDYGVRGFYFANDPRDFYSVEQSYVQLGDPRTWGVTASYQF